MHPRVSPLLAALMLAAAGEVWAEEQPDTATVLVTVTQAHSLCLIETDTLPAPQAQSIAARFLAEQGISPLQRIAVQRDPQFRDLLGAYIQQRGGCRRLVDALMP